MGTGEVMPREVQVQAPVDTNNQDSSSSTRVEPPSSQANQDESLVHGDDHGRGFDQGGEQDDEAQHEAPQVEDDDDGPIQCQSQAPHPKSTSNGSKGSSRGQHPWKHPKRGDNSLKVDKLLCILLVFLLFGTS
jgi:hypothetical protein